jgi:hypothetical protein
MKKFFQKVLLALCLLLAVGAMEARAQSAQQPTNPRLQAEITELQAKLQKSDPNSNEYKDTKAAYDELLAKVNKVQEKETPNANVTTVAPAPKKIALPPVKVDGKLAKGTRMVGKSAKKVQNSTTQPKQDAQLVTVTQKTVKGNGTITGSPLRSLNHSKH